MNALALAPAFQGQQVRIVLINDEPWFVGRDVCDALGLGNSRDALGRLDEDGVGTADVIDSMGRTQAATVVNEAGLYELIFQSRRPEAREFRRWVTGTVLPEIRRTGSYGTCTPAIPQSFAEALQLAADLALENEQAQAALAAAAPKVAAYEALCDSDGLYSMEAAAKAIGLPGVGRNNLFRHLRELQILQGNRLPYQRYMHHFEIVLGTFTDRQGVTHPTSTTKVRPGAVDFLRRRLADHLGLALSSASPGGEA